MLELEMPNILMFSIDITEQNQSFHRYVEHNVFTYFIFIYYYVGNVFISKEMVRTWVLAQRGRWAYVIDTMRRERNKIGRQLSASVRSETSEYAPCLIHCLLCT
jgi:hypothetical protein